MRVVAVEMSQDLLGYLVTDGGEAHVKVTYGLPKGARLQIVSLTELGIIRMIFEHDSFEEVYAGSVPLHPVRFGTIQCSERWDTRYEAAS